MSRTLIAVLIGFVFIVAYVFAVLAVADVIVGLHWVLQAAFFLVAGLAWTLPIRGLMYWSVRR